MNFMKLPKVVLFDLDGTILDTENLYLNLMLQYNHHKNIFISKKFYIENFLGKSKDAISSIMEKVYNKDRSLDDDNSRWDVIRKFCDNEEAMLLELYKHGRLVECEKLGFSVEEIVFIQNLLESKRMPDNSLPLDSTIKQGETLKRVNYKMR